MVADVDSGQSTVISVDISQVTNVTFTTLSGVGWTVVLVQRIVVTSGVNTSICEIAPCMDMETMVTSGVNPEVATDLNKVLLLKR